eukprot:6474919-Amphidinium_carterae.1
MSLCVRGTLWRHWRERVGACMSRATLPRSYILSFGRDQILDLVTGTYKLEGLSGQWSPKTNICFVDSTRAGLGHMVFLVFSCILARAFLGRPSRILLPRDDRKGKVGFLESAAPNGVGCTFYIQA